MPLFLAVVAFFRFCRAVVLGSSSVFRRIRNYFSSFGFGTVLFDFFVWVLVFFVFCQRRWYRGLFISTVVAVLGKEFYGCFQVYGLFTDKLLPNFLSVIHVMNFDVRISSCFMFLKSQFCFSVTSFFQCSSGVSLTSCFVQKKSPQLW